VPVWAGADANPPKIVIKSVNLEYPTLGAQRRGSQYRWPCDWGGEAAVSDPMTPEHILREKLRKIEALFAGAATAGEKAAAGAAAERIRERLGKTAGKETSIELKLSIPDVWSRQLFIALCRRYGLRPFRHRRMHRQTIMIKAPKSFIEQVLWPEFQELNAALIAYLSEITEKVIREEVHGDTGEAEEVDEPARISR
jgi:hypothetical protein